ncbi:Transcription factor fungi [Macrophomina phaseolina MS6]|uniref:Transcription factor fungi n=1 Tax=Macrophomina phaseolina (strain MS6) TaxID=1126212 RepID=K2SL50_MACPH|nr:Transcription factor fungi [Macrophomina phaseolina MS6]
MNRNLGKPPDFGQAPAGGKDRPWANVWWCCYVRDVWASLFLGRPARVKSAESDAPMPDIDELPTLLQGLSAQVKEKYLPKEMDELLRLWRILLEITIVLEDVLTVCYRISSSTPANTGIGVLMDRFSACEEKLRTFSPRTSRLLDLQYYQLDIMMQAVKITLYKPYLLPRTEKATSQLHSHYPLAIQKVREAANEANAGLNKMATAGVIDLCQSSFIIALVPVMQIHLYDATSKDHLTKQLGLRRLEFCMTLCKELRKTFFGASVISSFFSGALVRMKENASASRDRLEGCQTPGESSPYRRPDFEVDIDNVEQPEPNVYGDGTASREQIPIAQTLEGRWAIDPTIDQDGMMTLLLSSYGLTDLWNLQNDPSF